MKPAMYRPNVQDQVRDLRSAMGNFEPVTFSLRIGAGHTHTMFLVDVRHDITSHPPEVMAVLWSHLDPEDPRGVEMRITLTQKQLDVLDRTFGVAAGPA